MLITILFYLLLHWRTVSSSFLSTSHTRKSTLSTRTKACWLQLLPPDVTHGEELFRQFCASCHPGGTNVIARERDLHKEALEKIIGLAEEEDGIIKFVKNSNIHRGALAFTGRLSDQDFKDVGRYVYIQAMEKEWDL